MKRKILCKPILLIAIISAALLAGCSGNSDSTIEETPEKTEEKAVQEETKDEQDEAMPDQKSLAQRMAGKYSYHYSGDNGDELYVMDVVPFGDNLYAFCGQAMQDEQESSGVYTFWASEFIPDVAKEITSTDGDTVAVNELRFSVMSNEGKYWDSGCKGTITLTDEGLVFKGFDNDSFLKGENEDSRLFAKDDSVDNAFSYLKADDTGAPEDLQGMWVHDDKNAGIYIEFSGSNMFLYRKDPAQEVFYAAGGCNYHDDSFEFTGNMIENGGMPFELSGEYKIDKDALTLKFQGYDVPDWLSDSEDFKRVEDSQVHVTTMDEVKHTADAPDYIVLYKPVFDEVLEAIEYGFNIDREYTYVSGGLSEKIMYPGDADPKKSIGYQIKDLSGDGVPELLIGSDEEYDGSKKSYIYILCTLIDDKPAMVAAGSTRSSYNYVGDGHFYYEGSGGASITIFGENHLKEDGSELLWDDFYFSDEKEDGTIGIYYNNSGIFGAKDAEELSISETEFRDKMNGYHNRCEEIEWTLISF